MGSNVSDYLDVLLPYLDGPEQRRAGLAALLDSLLARPRGWDALDLVNLPGESPTAAELTALADERGLPWMELPGHARPYIEFDVPWSEYLRTRPSRFRYNLRSRLRRLTRLGAVRFRTLRRPDEVSDGLVDLTRLHARRWEGQHTGTILSSAERGRDFYAEAVPRCAARGHIDLTLLELNDHAVAGALCFVGEDTFYYYLPAWEPELAAYAPSSLLLAHLIERTGQQGLFNFDFMLGDESYKANWATGQRRTVRLVLGNRGVRGRAAFAAIVGAHRVRCRARQSDLLRHLRRYGARGLLRGLHSYGRN